MKKGHPLICFCCALVLFFECLSFSDASSASTATDSSSIEAMGYYTFIFSEDAEFAWAREIIGNYSMCVPGYLYIQDLVSKEVWQVLDFPIDSFRTIGNMLYCIVDGTQIIQTDYWGEATDIVYVSEHGSLGNMEISNGWIYFSDGDYVIRCNQANKTVQQLSECENISFLYPIEDGSFVWAGNNADVYHVWSPTETATLNDLDELIIGEIAVPRAAQVSISPYAVSFPSEQETFPFSDYPHGSYYNKYGDAPCECNPDCDLFGGCDCTSYRSSIQCMGFAKYAYDRYSHRDPTNTSWYTNDSDSHVQTGIALNTDEDVELLFRSLGYGAYLRLDRPNDGNISGDHSVVTAGVSAAAVTIYDANDDGRCKVQLRTFSFSAFRAMFDHVTRSIAHNFSGAIMRNNELNHVVHCDYDGCTGYILKRHYSYAPGANATCDACGYVGTITAIVPS